MRRPVKTIDPNDSEAYEADMDAWEKHEEDLADMIRDEECDEPEPQERCSNHGLFYVTRGDGRRYCGYCGEEICNAECDEPTETEKQ